MSLDGKQAEFGWAPQVKWLPLPIDICNTRGFANALPSQRQSWNVSCACNYTGTHTLQTRTQKRCSAAEIGMVVVLPRMRSFTKSSTSTKKDGFTFDSSLGQRWQRQSRRWSELIQKKPVHSNLEEIGVECVRKTGSGGEFHSFAVLYFVVPMWPFLLQNVLSNFLSDFTDSGEEIRVRKPVLVINISK